MAHFVKILNKIVIKGMVVEPEFFNSFVDDSPGEWIQTSYNTVGGAHQLGGTPFRKNYAGIGYTYDKQKDAFIPPKTYNSWVLNETTCLWEPPISYPQDEKSYTWNEQILNWELSTNN
jgi:hypothetical protein